MSEYPKRKRMVEIEETQYYCNKCKKNVWGVKQYDSWFNTCPDCGMELADPPIQNQDMVKHE